MSPEIQQTIWAYVVPALILAFLELRRRRLAASTKRAQIDAGRRASDFEVGQQLRDEIREENRELRERVDEQDMEIARLSKRVVVVETRVETLSALLVRNGIPLPVWAEEA